MPANFATALLVAEGRRYIPAVSVQEAQSRALLETISLGGRQTSLVTLESGPVRVRVIGYGATVVSVECPDRKGDSTSVVLGFEDFERYLGDHPYFGSTVGRYANRIRGAAFELDGRTVRLTPNENGNQLHGGPEGFHRAWFDARALCSDETATAIFTRTSPDGEGGFPGNVQIRVEYRLFAETPDRHLATGTHTQGARSRALHIDFRATTDRPTIVGMTHHGYWQLGGPSTDVRSQRLRIAADRYVPLDHDGIPAGEARSVRGSPFDFREPHSIGERIGDPAVAIRGGYDHPLIVGGKTTVPRAVATLWDASSGRRLDVRTTEPGLHLYTGQLLSPQATGHAPFSALCLETGYAPDVPNRPDLGSARLDPGEVYEHTVVYCLSLDPLAPGIGGSE